MKRTEKASPVVSIIVPVYKVAECYFRECVDSLLKQTLKNIEIILIDDGSPDNCGELCDTYAQQDSRIHVIHQENQGVSVARNRGMEVARGKWLIFVDADDWLEKTALDRLVVAAERMKVQILYFGSFLEWINGKQEIHYPFFNNTLILPEKKKEIYKNIFCSKAGMSLGSVCGKMYSKEDLRGSGIIFPIGCALHEDLIFQLLLLGYMDRLAYFDTCLYHYRSRAGSACKTFRADYVDQQMKSAKQVHEILADEEDMEVQEAFHMWLYEGFTQMIYNHFFNPCYSLPYQLRVQGCNAVREQAMYKEALETARKRQHMKRQKLGYFLLRKGLYGSYVFLKRLWSKRFVKRAFD